MKTATQSAEQIAYLDAKNAFDTLQAMKASLTGPFTAETDEEIDAFAEREEAVIREIGLDDALHTLRAAEKALLTWGTEYAAQFPQFLSGNRTHLENLATTNIARYRQAAIEIILRF